MTASMKASFQAMINKLTAAKNALQPGDQDHPLDAQLSEQYTAVIARLTAAMNREVT